MSLEVHIPKPIRTLQPLPYDIVLPPSSAFIAPNQIQAGITELDFTALGASIGTQLNALFQGCANLEAVDLSGWNTSNVTQMYGMWSGCTNLRKIWAPATFAASAVTVARYKPFYYAVGHAVDVYTDATSDADVNWGTVNANFTIHWNSTYTDFEEA